MAMSRLELRRGGRGEGGEGRRYERNGGGGNGDLRDDGKRCCSKALFTQLLNVCALLLLWGDGVNLAEADECGTKFTDPSSSTVLAQVVLQGAVKDMNPILGRSTTQSANVTVMSVYKGMDVLQQMGYSENGTVTVNHFGREDRRMCVAALDDMKEHSEHIFFLRPSSERGMLRMSAMPLPMERQTERRVRRSLCPTCVRPPRIKKVKCKGCATAPNIKSMKSKRVKMGKRAKLRCKARSKPAPTFTWSKSGVPITTGSGGITVRTTSTSSTLFFRRVTSAHSGEYTCVATNDIGTSESVVTLDVSRASDQSYGVANAPDRTVCQTNPCLNGGTCFYSRSLNLRRCVCPQGYEGVRCENLDGQSLPQAGNRGRADRRDSVDGTRGARGDRQDRTTRTVATTTTSTVANRQNSEDRKTEEATQRRNRPIVTPETQHSSDGDVVRKQDSSTSRQDDKKSVDASENISTVGTSLNTGHNLSASVDSVSTSTHSFSSTSSSTASKTVTTTNTGAQNSTSVNQVNPFQTGNQTPTQITNTRETKSQNKVRTTPSTRPQKSKSTKVNKFKPRKKKGYLKVVYCKEKNYCFNGGRCKFIRKQNRKYCECPVGYTGKRCQLVDLTLSLRPPHLVREGLQWFKLRTLHPLRICIYDDRSIQETLLCRFWHF